jgi:hypothetical protein
MGNPYANNTAAILAFRVTLPPVNHDQNRTKASLGEAKLLRKYEEKAEKG